MYQFNPQVNVDRINRQIEDLNNLKQQMMIPPQQQPINNYINTGSTIDFEARLIQGEELPENIIVSRKTAFIDLNKGILSVKELNGDIKSYEIVLPKTPEQIENEKLKLKIKELEDKINGFTKFDKSSRQNKQSNSSAVRHDESTAKANNE